MTRYVLDTNTVSYLIKGHPVIARHVVTVPMPSVCISSITEGELLFGLAKRPSTIRLHNAVRKFLLCIDVLSWDSVAAQNYRAAQADMERRGRVLAPLDLLIAAQALASNRRHHRNEHLFQGRFKGILVDKDAYLLDLSRYVVLNPVRAGLVRSPEKWPWSSYRAMMGEALVPKWLAVDGLLSQFGSKPVATISTLFRTVWHPTSGRACTSRFIWATRHS